jgi:LysM repeat protein
MQALPTALILFPDANEGTPALAQTPITPQPDCSLPPGWTIYVVQPGDTLFGIAQVTNSTVNDLLTANCLSREQDIVPGQTLFVPQAPFAPVPTVAPEDVSTLPELGVVGCEVPGVTITSPTAGQAVAGIFNITGTASIPNFAVYLVEIRPAAERAYTVYSFSQEQVIDGSLATINARFFRPGLHFIRLAVADTNGVPQTCVVPVIFR